MKKFDNLEKIQKDLNLRFPISNYKEMYLTEIWKNVEIETKNKVFFWKDFENLKKKFKTEIISLEIKDYAIFIKIVASLSS